MDCPSCGHQNREAAKFCGNCAQSLATATRCSACGSENPRGQRFCDECGGPLASPAGSAPRSGAPRPLPADPSPADEPTALAGGRYRLERFLGEGAKKRVHLARADEILISGDVQRRVDGASNLRIADERAVTLKGFSGEHRIAAVDWK